MKKNQLPQNETCQFFMIYKFNKHSVLNKSIWNKIGFSKFLSIISFNDPVIRIVTLEISEALVLYMSVDVIQNNKNHHQ